MSKGNPPSGYAVYLFYLKGEMAKVVFNVDSWTVANGLAVGNQKLIRSMIK
jgi:hypothetical protein